MKSIFKKSPQLSASSVEVALRSVLDPLSGRDIVSAGLVSAIRLQEGGRVGFVLCVPRQEAARYEAVSAHCKDVVGALPGVTHVTPVLTAETSPTPEAPPKARAQWNLTPVEGVGRIIAIASGKGGVGKSTTTVQLARALQQRGLRIGILDADIYGPSIPRMLGAAGVSESTSSPAQLHDNQLLPFESGGIKAMSMGHLLAGKAAIMRGPMVTKSLVQMLRGTRWGQLDLLLVDMPPGTGDVHLSMVQQVPLAYGGGGAIIVTTPQDVALDDARKAADMFLKVEVPILGIIENMSYFADPAGQKHYVFGQGGGGRLADELNVPLLGNVPLLSEIQHAGETGTAEAATPYAAIAAAL